VFFGNNLLLPLWLQTQVGYIATWAGLVAAPSGAVAVLLTPVAARMLNKVDARWTATVSLVAFAASYFLRSQYSPDSSFGVFVVPLMVQGIAMSTFFVSMVTLTLNGVPQQQVPQATGLSNFTRITAGSFAASLATTIWDRSEALHQTRLSEAMAARDPSFVISLEKLQGAGLTLQQAIGAVTQQVIHQAYFLAALDFFRVSAWLTVLMIPCVWLTRKALGGGGGHAAAD
jgi:DHA2 family multidrug resistance protein